MIMCCLLRGFVNDITTLMKTYCTAINNSYIIIINNSTNNNNHLCWTLLLHWQDLSIKMNWSGKIVLYHSSKRTSTPHKTKVDWFGDENWVNSRNFIATTLRFSEKYDYPISPFFVFGNMFRESHGFFDMRVTICIKDTCSNLSLSNQWRETKLFELVTTRTMLGFTAMKPCNLRNMLPNINTCENRWSYFSENLRVVAMKLLELTQFASPYLSIYFNFLHCWGPFWCWYF